MSEEQEESENQQEESENQQEESENQQESYLESENPHRKIEQTQGIDTNFDAEQLKKKVSE